MKKKNLKSLQLNKKSISNFTSQEIKGGDTIIACVKTLTIAVSWMACPGTHESCACISDNNQNSCDCTIA